jgi:uncharacterized protein
MIKQKIQADQIQALKAKDQTKLTTLRFILSQIQNKEIIKKSDLNDEETVDVLRKVVSELNESIAAFEKGNRPDLLADSQKQLIIVLTYLPPEISDDDLKKEIEKLIAQNNELYQKNPKMIIGLCMKELKGKAGSARIMTILNSILK